jgi:7,8-dihydropterin-6-yl-methyl-4-(beta-D-ribofuranosyl)aminobenzene 5'-phosphate synthase
VIVSVLMDNVANDPAFHAAHGLSFGIETSHGAYVFDFGSDQRFIANAQRLGFPIEHVKAGVLSHGHYDHGGGLSAFLNLNSSAVVLVSSAAFDMYYSAQDNGDFKYIGLDPSLRNHPRLVFSDHDDCPSPLCTILTDVERRVWNPSGNLSLFALRDGKMEPDDFRHEIHLVIEDDGQLVLFSGCGHSGILNILEAVNTRFGRYPDVSFGGLHLHSPSGKTDEHEVYLKHLADTMTKIPTRFYTGHCTGEVPFAYLRTSVGQQLQYAYAGCRFNTREDSVCG